MSILCYCKKCGRIVQESAKSNKICDYCTNEVLPIPDEYLDEKCKIMIKDELKEQFINEYIKSSPEFDQYLFDHRDEDLFNRRVQDEAKMAHGRAILEGKSSGPKCPICGSGNISKVGLVGRAVSVGIFGLASSKIGKTHKCNNCGTTW